MICAKCSQEIPDSSEACPLCGGDAKIASSLPAFRSAASTGDPAQSTSSGRSQAAVSDLDPKLRGVDGWLLVFCLVLTAVNALVVALWARTALQSLPVLINLIFAVYSMAVGVALWTLWPSALPMLKFYFRVLLWIIVLDAVLSFLTPRTTSKEVMRLVFSFIWLLVWRLYFSSSARVRNTYGHYLR